MDEVKRIKALKEAEKQVRSGCSPGCLIAFALLVILAVVAMNLPAASPLVPIPPTPLMTRQTVVLLPTPTLAPTWTAVGVEVAAESVASPTATAQATQTAQPTQTPLPTHTPQPTLTALPTYTPQPTLTALPTYTSQPTLTAPPTAVALVVATSAPASPFTPTPPPTNPTMPLQVLLFGAAAAVVALMAVIVVWLWEGRHLTHRRQYFERRLDSLIMALWGPKLEDRIRVHPPQLTQARRRGPRRMPPLPGQNTGANTGVTGVTGANTGAESENTTIDPEKIEVGVKPTNPEVDEDTMRRMCEIYNDLERPSLTQLCVQFFGSKNSERLALARRAIRWGREHGLVSDGT